MEQIRYMRESMIELVLRRAINAPAQSALALTCFDPTGNIKSKFDFNIWVKDVSSQILAALEADATE